MMAPIPIVAFVTMLPTPASIVPMLPAIRPVFATAANNLFQHLIAQFNRANLLYCLFFLT
jgi:hypothetical protein